MELKYDKEKLKSAMNCIKEINEKWNKIGKECNECYNNCKHYRNNAFSEFKNKLCFTYLNQIGETKKLIEKLNERIIANEDKIKKVIGNQASNASNDIINKLKPEKVAKDTSAKQAFNWDRLDDTKGLSEKEYNEIIKVLEECGISYEEIQGKTLEELKRILSNNGKGQYIEKLKKYYEYICEIQKVKKDRKNEPKAEEIGNNTKVQELYDELKENKNKDIIDKAKQILLEKTKGALTEEKLNNLTVNELIKLLEQYGEYYLAGQVNDVLIRAAIHGKGTTTYNLVYGESVEEWILKNGVNPYEINGNEITFNKNRKPEKDDIQAMKKMSFGDLKKLFSENYEGYYDANKIEKIEDILKKLYNTTDINGKNTYELFTKLKENGYEEEANYLIGMYYVMNLGRLQYDPAKGEFGVLPYDVEKRYTAQLDGNGKGRTYSLFNQEMEGYEELQSLWNGDGICVPSSVASLVSGFGINISQKDAINNLRKLAELYAEKYGDNKYFDMSYMGNKFLGLCSYGLHVVGYDIQDCTDRQKHVENIWQHLIQGYPVAVSKHGNHPVELDDGTTITNPTTYHSIVFIDYRTKSDGTRQVKISDSYNTYTKDNDGWVDLEYFVKNHMDGYMLVDDKNEDSVYYFDGYNSNNEYYRTKVTVPKGTSGIDVVEKLTYETVKSDPNYGSDTTKIEDYNEVVKVDDYDSKKQDEDNKDNKDDKDDKDDEDDEDDEDNKDDEDNANKEKIEQIEIRIDEIQRRLNEIDGTLNELKEKKGMIKEQLKMYEEYGTVDVGQLRENEANVISEKQVDFNRRQNELDERKQKLETTRKNLEEKSKKLAEAEESLQKDKEVIDASIKTKNEELEGYKKDLSSAETTYNDLMEAYDKLEEQYYAEDDYENSQKIKEKMEEKQLQVDDAKNAVDELKEKKRNCEDQINDIKGSLEEKELQFETDKANYESELNDYNFDNQQLTKNYNNLETDRADEIKRQKYVEDQIKEIEKNLASKEELEKNLEEINKQTEELTNEQKSLKEEQEKLEKEKKDLQKK